MATATGDRGRSRRRAAAPMADGVAAAVAAAAIATVAARLLAGVVPFAGAIVLAVAAGIALAPVLPDRLRPGLTWSARTPLRAGVVLLGLQLSVGDVLTLGLPTLVAVVLTVLTGFAVTLAAGAALGVPRPVAVLVATGCSICGAAAVAAMGGALRARAEAVAAAIALVTLFGTGAIVAIPWLAGLLDLDDRSVGAWAGIAVHEVAQVVAASAPAGPAALTVAVVVKLTRVLLLAPVVAVATVVSARAGTAAEDTVRPPLVPPFVLLFAAAVLVRSLGLAPDAVVRLSAPVATFLLTAALFALGTAVRPRALLDAGGRTLLLGAVASVTVAGSGLGLLALLGAL